MDLLRLLLCDLLVIDFAALLGNLGRRLDAIFLLGGGGALFLAVVGFLTSAEGFLAFDSFDLSAFSTFGFQQPMVSKLDPPWSHLHLSYLRKWPVWIQKPWRGSRFRGRCRFLGSNWS